ncbi:DNA polymerase III subunit delta' [bacterium]|nr:DNA polymerase III subunit delta' [bacterium]
MSWDRIIGQQRVKQLLQRMLESERIPHALLFYGPEGVGKEAAAITFARALNCEQGGWEPCGTCASCRGMAELHHPNLKLIFALPSKDDESSAVDKLSSDELEEMHQQIAEKAENLYHRIRMSKASVIKVSSVRDIRREAAFRAGKGGRTVVVICEADLMNSSAANALLKTLEEPGGDLLLILCTSRKDALLPTIVSRCQSIRFDTLPEELIREALQREQDVQREQVDAAAHLSGGNYAAALEMAREGGLISREEVLQYVRDVVLNNPIKLFDRIQGILGREDRQTLSRFLISVGSWFRDVEALQAGAQNIINTDLRDPLEKFAAHYPDADCSRAVDEIEHVIALLRKNVHLATVMIVLSHRLRSCIIPPS